MLPRVPQSQSGCRGWEGEASRRSPFPLEPSHPFCSLGLGSGSSHCLPFHAGLWASPPASTAAHRVNPPPTRGQLRPGPKQCIGSQRALWGLCPPWSDGGNRLHVARLRGATDDRALEHGLGGRALQFLCVALREAPSLSGLHLLLPSAEVLGGRLPSPGKTRPSPVCVWRG